MALLAAIALPVSRGDTILLKNGDRVTGSIVKQDGKTLTIKTASFGLVTTPWAGVESVVTDQDLFVETRDGHTRQGRVELRGEVLRIGAESVSGAEIAAIRNDEEQARHRRLVQPRWSSLWNTRTNLGWAGTRGNAETDTFTLAFDADRTTTKDKTAVRFNLIRAVARTDAEVADTARAVRGGVKYNHNLNSRLFVNSFNDYEFDRFQNLDLRVVAGTGLGLLVAKGERGRFDLVGGGAFNHETFDPAPGPRFSRNRAETYWGSDLTVRPFPRLQVTQAFRMFTPLPESGSYRYNWDVSLSNRLTRWLSWNLAVGDRFLAVPVPGRRRNDWLYTSGVGLNLTR